MIRQHALVKEKVCSKCKRRLPVSSFWRCARHKGEEKKYLKSECKECYRIRYSKYISDPEIQSHKKSMRVVWREARKIADPLYLKKDREKKRVWWIDQVKDALIAYGGKCAICGETRLSALVLHHKDGNGKKHREELREKYNIDTSRFYYYLKREGYPPGLQALCGTCHLILHRKESVQWQSLDTKKPERAKLSE